MRLNIKYPHISTNTILWMPFQGTSLSSSPSVVGPVDPIDALGYENPAASSYSPNLLNGDGVLVADSNLNGASTVVGNYNIRMSGLVNYGILNKFIVHFTIKEVSNTSGVQSVGFTDSSFTSGFISVVGLEQDLTLKTIRPIFSVFELSTNKSLGTNKFNRISIDPTNLNVGILVDFDKLSITTVAHNPDTGELVTDTQLLDRTLADGTLTKDFINSATIQFNSMGLHGLLSNLSMYGYDHIEDVPSDLIDRMRKTAIAMSAGPLSPCYYD